MLPSPERGRNAAKRFGVFFDTWPLVTPSANDLRAFVQAMVQWGVWEPNDARERMHMNPLDTPAADSTWMQINMAPVAQLFETPALPGAGGDDQGDNEDAKPGATKDKAGRARRGDRILITRVSRAYSRLFRDAFGRMCRRSQADEATFRQVFMPVLVSIGEELEQYAAQILDTAVNSDGIESSRFLAGYLGTMFHRFEGEEWPSANGSAQEICDRELSRAIRALAIEAYRNAATAAAKLETEVQS
jgi:hypothetical protein